EDAAAAHEVPLVATYDGGLGTGSVLEQRRHGLPHGGDQPGERGDGGTDPAVLETAQVRRGDAGVLGHLARRQRLQLAELAQAWDHPALGPGTLPRPQTRARSHR